MAKEARPDFGAWSLSHDGRRISLVDVSSYPSTMRILDLESRAQERRIPLEGPPPSGGLAAWSADDQGWFLAAEPDRMLYFDQHGHSHFVHDVGFWAVPSWDGKKLAFLDKVRESDVYWTQR